MLTLKIEIEGNTESDVETALDEVKRKVLAGFRYGRDSNATGKYDFEVTGEEIPSASKACDGCGDEYDENTLVFDAVANGYYCRDCMQEH